MWKEKNACIRLGVCVRMCVCVCEDIRVKKDLELSRVNMDLSCETKHRNNELRDERRAGWLVLLAGILCVGD